MNDLNVVDSIEWESTDKLLDALDQMQGVWMGTFRHRPEFLHAYNWNVCKELWRRRGTDEPIEKSEVIRWRKPDRHKAIIGENNARKIVDGLILDGFLEKYELPSQPRVIFVRPTPKLRSSLEEIFSVGVEAAKQAFAY